MAKKWFGAFIDYITRFILFLGTFAFAIFLALISIGLRYFFISSSLRSAMMVILLIIGFYPIALAYFPMGLLAPIALGYNGIYRAEPYLKLLWIIYIFIILASGFIQNRQRFIMLYRIFVILLILNIAGCAIIGPEMLSDIN